MVTVDLHRLVAEVGDALPAASWTYDTSTVGDLLAEGQIVLAGSDLGSAVAAFEADELVGVGVLLKSDVAAGRERHEGACRHLPLLSGCGGSCSRTLGLQVERLGTGPDVSDTPD